MTIKELPDFSELKNLVQMGRKAYLESNPLQDEYLRSEREALEILEVLEKITLSLVKTFETYPTLAGVFEKDFGNLEHFFKRETIIDLCFIEDYLFPRTESLPLIVYDQFDSELISSYAQTIEDWCQDKINLHNSCQKKLEEEFSDTTNFKNLECQCVKCVADYRGRLRQSVFHFCLNEINQAEDKVLNEHENLSMQDLSNLFQSVKKKIEMKIHQVRYRLKKGSLNKLEKQVNQIITDRFGPSTDIGAKYKQKVHDFCLSCKDEFEIQDDLIGEVEFKRFYEQLGLNIWRNEKYLKRELGKLTKSLLVLKRKDISSTILQDYLGQFWIHSEARHLKRKVVYHMGPTNSGKTYHAIERLAAAKKGCYLAPLRLLASELYDTLGQKGVATTLLTGEEVIETENATHFSSTIEMARFHEDFEVCVIDEIQMITDAQRGWAWTRAFVNIHATEVHLCGDPSVLGLIERLVELTGDTLEVKQYERLTELRLGRGAITAGELGRGDAVIVFSRKKALKYKADLERMGLKVSIVYGRLSPEVRREQARKFDEGETDIIVSTDAISMGMNLPIKRIVFTTLSKFINGQEFPITDSEIKQISGRAGRYGRYPIGEVTCFSRVDAGMDRIQEALECELEQSKVAMVGPDLEIFERVNQALAEPGLALLRLSEFLRLFNTMSFESPFYCVDLHEMIEVAEMVEHANSEKGTLSSSEIFGFTCAPVNLGLIEHVQYFVWIVNRYVSSLPIPSDGIDFTSDNIDYLETSIKCVELYQWLARHFNNKNFEFGEEELLENKSKAIDKLNDLLSEKLIRNCTSCGVKLADSFEYNICEECFKNRKFTRRPNWKPGPKSEKSRKKSSSSNKKRHGKGPKRRKGFRR